MLNGALHQVVVPTKFDDYQDRVQEFGIIPALVAAGAAVMPMLGSKKAKQDAKKLAKTIVQQEKKEKAAAEQREKEKNKTMFYVGAGLTSAVLIGLVIYVVTRPKTSARKKK